MLRNTVQIGISIPRSMINGTEFIKLNNSKSNSKTRTFKYDPDLQRILWNSKKLGVIQLDWITDIKLGASAIDPESKSSIQVKNNVDLYLTIWYTHKNEDKQLSLIAFYQDQAEIWYHTIKNLVSSAISGPKEDEEKNAVKDSYDVKLGAWLKQHWAVIDKNKDGKMDLKEFKVFMNLINIECSDQDIKVLFKRADVNNVGYLDFNATKRMYYMLQTRPETQKLFSSLTKMYPDVVLTEKEFLGFLKETQGENPSPEEFQTIFEKYSQQTPFPGISKEQFILYLCSDDNNPLKPLDSSPLQDMTQPLSHYWINSSHNTYLTGDQLISASSTAEYKKALLNGCRCVELDCWDGPKGEPVIYHGHTLTSKILFKDVIETVKEYAFKVSPYPVILSLEVHCSVPQQDSMAQHLKAILGDILVTERLEPDNEDISIQRLPSPEKLMNKIILKGKALSSNGKVTTLGPGQSVSELKPGSNEPATLSLTPIHEEAPSFEDDDESDKEQKNNTKVSKILSDLTPYCQTGKFVSYEHATVNMKYYQMSSFSETGLNNVFNKALSLKPVIRDYILHNQRCLSRTYPGGIRMNSSNYNPLPYWFAGFQMVAMNFQTNDVGMELNTNFFRQNRGLGYVLKPDYMRDPLAKLPLPSPTKHLLHVRVISGQNLPKPKDETTGEVIDPFIEVQVITMEFGTKYNPGIEANLEAKTGVCSLREELVTSTASFHDLTPVVVRKSQKSDVVVNNGFNPTWSMHSLFMFSNLEHTYLRFKIHEFNKRTVNDEIGTYSIKLTDLKPGYRHVPVHNSKNGAAFPFASLFIMTSLETHSDPNIFLRSNGPNEPTHYVSIDDLKAIHQQLDDRSETVSNEPIIHQQPVQSEPEAIRYSDATDPYGADYIAHLPQNSNNLQESINFDKNSDLPPQPQTKSETNSPSTNGFEGHDVQPALSSFDGSSQASSVPPTPVNVSKPSVIVDTGLPNDISIRLQHSYKPVDAPNPTLSSLTNTPPSNTNDVIASPTSTPTNGDSQAFASPTIKARQPRRATFDLMPMALPSFPDVESSTNPAEPN